MNSLIISNQSAVSILGNDPTFGGTVNDKGALVGARVFIAAALGATVTKDLTVKDLRDAYGKDKVKALSTKYDEGRSAFYGASKKLAALAAADPNMRVESRIAMGKNGAIGINTKFRFEKAASKQNAEARAKAAEERAESLAQELAILRKALQGAA